MGWLEYAVAAAALRLLGLVFGRFPFHPRRVVFATARTVKLEGNLAAIHGAMRGRRPDLEVVLLLEPYSYGWGGKAAYFARLVRGMYYVQTSALVVIDNAYFPVHVMPHRPRTTVVQVWHAAGALKKFGLDAALRRPVERLFLHRYYDFVVVGGEAARLLYATALRTPIDRIVPIGSPRTDVLFDADAMAAARQRLLATYEELRGRTVVLYAPTFRGGGAEKRAARGFDAARLRELLPVDYALVLKTHPNLDAAATPTEGFDVVIDPMLDINQVFAIADILVTDFSSSIFEWALLRRPLILHVADLESYERDPGLYLDYRTDMIGEQVTDVERVARVILEGAFDLAAYEAFIAKHLGASDGRATERFVERFAPASPRGRAPANGPQGADAGTSGQSAANDPRATLPADVRDR